MTKPKSPKPSQPPTGPDDSSWVDADDTPPRATPVHKSRIVVTQTITHVPPKGEPTSLAVGVARNCTSDEVPYRRPSGSFVVGGDWRPLDLGWLGEDGATVGSFALYNTEGTTLDRIPTPEERESIDRRVVEVGVLGSAGELIPAFLVHPGDVFRGLPVDKGLVVVRCRDAGQKARCDLVVFPG